MRQTKVALHPELAAATDHYWDLPEPAITWSFSMDDKDNVETRAAHEQ